MADTADADPHGDCTVSTAGADLADADLAVIALHGRGARAESVLDLARQAGQDVDDVAYLAPQAAGLTWYPASFMEPIEHNEPHLTSALAAVRRLLERATDHLDREAVVLVGFSQGACLASEFVARHADRYGGLVAFSGGLIGPPGTDFTYDGTLADTPVFLGCSDRDPHIPLERVHETETALEALDGDVTTRIYEGMGHTVNEDELDALRSMLAEA